MNSKPLEDLTFFIDRALGKNKIASALREAGETVIVHDDIFQPDAQDTEWLPFVGDKGWIVLTKDTKIRYRTLEREALINSGARAFVFVSGNVPAVETAQILVKILPAMKEFINKHQPPFIAKIFRNGSLELMKNV